MKQHPLYYILAAVAGVLLGAALLDLISGSWNEASFWQAAALGFLAVIAALSIDLFRRVCRFYSLVAVLHQDIQFTSQLTTHPMKRISSLGSIIAIIAVFSFSACKKTGNEGLGSGSDTGQVYLEMFNVVGGSNLNLNNQWYKNANGDSFKVSKFNYYLSNIRLNNESGVAYTEPNSYHLVEQPTGPGQIAFNMNSGVPVGAYTSITFMIGVDSTHNVSGAQEGDLDPALGNFWSWNTGYIMLKFEGNSPKSPNPDGLVMLHSGGFSGANSVLKTVTIPFETPIVVTKSQEPHVHLQADVLQMFKAPNGIDFSKIHTIHMPGANAKMLADNYAGMFSITYAGY